MSNNNFRIFRVGNKYSLSPMSSSKKLANRTNIKYAPNSDKSLKQVYQIDKSGNIVKTWNSINEIMYFFNVEYSAVYDAIKRQKIVADCLFVKMLDYKSSIDYSILIKYIKYNSNKKSS